ncbi:DUF4304 domain-containing protein [Nocardioides bizhenqiangii]|uniref:DUF4304 domain-containing protein n=1 Tax=Nocardioides bizhenqiangii TaxID=3095076 RepID=A0ABZ0ZVU0_9ACTN|nr:DUF4304 domain-containing protein [Nocardioides sp. HM61]WQQ28377.1 DUF4304 domain-containing protein [Nocardioides sp. HM61]
MTAQDALKSALREVLSPVARDHGYKGSSPNWRKSSAAGDWAIVNVQSSSSSSARSLSCVINLAFAPEPWLRWHRSRRAHMPKAIPESLGLYRQRLGPVSGPTSSRGWWEVVDAESAGAVVTDMCAQLDRAGWPVLDEMFSREALKTRLEEGDLGFIKRAHFEYLFSDAEALLLMDSGMSDELESRLDSAMSHVPREKRDSTLQFVAWVRSQAVRGHG